MAFGVTKCPIIVGLVEPVIWVFQVLWFYPAYLDDCCSPVVYVSMIQIQVYPGARRTAMATGSHRKVEAWHSE